MIAALLAALVVAQAAPGDAGPAPEPGTARASSHGQAQGPERTGPREPETRPPPPAEAAVDDEDVIRNLELLENLDFLEHADAFDPKADD